MKYKKAVTTTLLNQLKKVDVIPAPTYSIEINKIGKLNKKTGERKFKTYLLEVLYNSNVNSFQFFITETTGKTTKEIFEQTEKGSNKIVKVFNKKYNELLNERF